MKKLSIVFFLFIFTCSFAQVPGYIGKRGIVSYSVKFFPAFSGPTARATNNGEFEPVGISSSHGLNLEYVHHRRKAICLMVQYARTGVDYTEVLYVRYDGNKKKPAVLTSMGFGVGIKLFKRANFAPYGPYVKWEAMMFSNTVAYDPNHWSIQDSNSPTGRTTVTQGSGKISFEKFGVGFSFGRQRIVADKIVIDRGIKFMLAPSEGFGNTQSMYSTKSMFETHGGLRLMNHQIINFHVGIGFLAF